MIVYLNNRVPEIRLRFISRRVAHFIISFGYILPDFFITDSSGVIIERVVWIFLTFFIVNEELRLSKEMFYKVAACVSWMLPE